MLERRDNFLDGLNNLDVIECKLNEALKDLEIVGLLSITKDDLEKLGHLIRDYINHKSMDQIKNRFSHCLAVFMVFEGVYEYRAGNYWEPLCKRLSVDSGTWKQDWGDFFLVFLRKYSFPQFREIGGHKYVARILAHGGIPNYCLGDFFAHLLWPAVNEMWGTDAQEVLADWDNHLWLQTFTDQPVRRFLQHGGQAATDFLERCLEMGYRTQEDGKVPDAQEVGLPSRIVIEFQEWVREKHLFDSQQPKRTRSYSRKPFITYDPYDSNGIVLNLPEQLLPISPSSEEKIYWVIKCDVEETTVPVNLFRYDSSFIKTGEKTYPLSPAHRYHIQLSTGSEPVEQWHLKGLSDSRPGLVFNPYNMRLLDINKLSKQFIWLVYPKAAQLSSDDVVDLPSLPEPWCDYQACEVVLKSSVTLQYQGHKHQFAYQDPTAHLHFTDGVLVPEAGENEDGVPFYSELPKLVIPKEHFNRRGTLVIIPQGVTHLASYREIQGHELTYITTKDSYEIPLSDERVLGENAVGKFLLHWQWQGHDKKLYLWNVPGLKIDSPKLLVGTQQAQVSIVAPSTTKLELETKGVEVNSSREANSRIDRLSIAPDCIEIKGNLKYPLKTQICEITLTIQVPRLRWGIRGLGNQSFVDWQENPISLTLAELEQANDPCLMFKTTHPVQGLDFHSLLLRATKQKPMETCKPERAHIPHFYLRKFLQNTIATTQLGKYSVALELNHPENGREEIPVLQIQRPLQISNFTMSSKVENDQLCLSISWQGGSHTKGLVLRLWNLWKPWQVPWIINDIDNRNSVELNEPLSEQSPGYYRIQFDVEDPWVHPKINHPAKDAPDVFDQKIAPERWEDHLSSLSGIWGVLEHFFANRVSQMRLKPSQTRITKITSEEIQQVLEQAHFVQKEYGKEGLYTFHNHLRKHVSLIAFFKAVLKNPKLATESLLCLLVGLGVAQDPETRFWFLQQAETLNDEMKWMFWEWWVPFGLWAELSLKGLKYSRLMENVEHYLGLESDEDSMLWQNTWRLTHAHQWNDIEYDHEVWSEEDCRLFEEYYRELKKLLLPSSLVEDLNSWSQELLNLVSRQVFAIRVITLTQRLMARCFVGEKIAASWSNQYGFQVFEAFPKSYQFELCFIEMEYRVFNDFSNTDLEISDYGIPHPQIHFKAKQLSQGALDEFDEIDVVMTDLGIVVKISRPFSDPQFFPFYQLERYRYWHHNFLTDMWFYFSDEVLLPLNGANLQAHTAFLQYLRCLIPDLLIEEIPRSEKM